MKKSIVLLAASCVCAFASLAFTGCQSSSLSLADYSPVAVVSVYSFAGLPWYVEDNEKTSKNSGKASGGMLTKTVNSTLNSSDPEIQTLYTRTDKAAEILEQLLVENNISVISREDINKYTEYATLGNGFFSTVDPHIGAEGYPVILSPNGKVSRNISEVTGAKGTIYAYFEFRKRKRNMGAFNTHVAAYTRLEVQVRDENGKKILSRSYTAESSDSVPYKNGNWDKNALVSFFPETISSVVNQFIFDLTPDSGAVVPPVSADVAEGAEGADAEEVQGIAIDIPLPVPTQSLQSQGQAEESLEERAE